MMVRFDAQSFEIEFVPPLDVPAKANAEVHLEWPSGHGWIRVHCMVSGCLIEERPDCQLIDRIEGVPILKSFVAAPESIRRPKLRWRVQLLRWLAKE